MSIIGFFSGLLCCSPELGLKEVHDWMVISIKRVFHTAYLQPFKSISRSSIPTIQGFDKWWHCSVVLFPVAITFFVTWWFVQFVDSFFSPLYARLGINIFGMFLVLQFHCCWSSSGALENIFVDFLLLLTVPEHTCRKSSSMIQL